jgi:hypothetical protein
MSARSRRSSGGGRVACRRRRHVVEEVEEQLCLHQSVFDGSAAAQEQVKHCFEQHLFPQPVRTDHETAPELDSKPSGSLFSPIQTSFALTAIPLAWPSDLTEDRGTNGSPSY